MSSGDLKPCPFCGGAAHTAHRSGDAWFVAADHEPGCRLQDFQRSEADAVAAWNRRTPEPVQEMHELDAPACSKPGACASPACIVENTCLFPHVDGSAAVGELVERLRAIAKRYRVSNKMLLTAKAGRPLDQLQEILAEAGEADAAALTEAANTLEALVRERDEAVARGLAIELDRIAHAQRATVAEAERDHERQERLATVQVLNELLPIPSPLPDGGRG